VPWAACRRGLPLTRVSEAPDPLEELSSEQLHHLATRRAVERRDVRFLWELLELLPAAEAAAGELDDALADVLTMRGRIDDLTDAGRRPIADALRPYYLDYLRRNGVPAAA
jgi:hypothetical protein